MHIHLLFNAVADEWTDNADDVAHHHQPLSEGMRVVMVPITEV